MEGTEGTVSPVGASPPNLSPAPPQPPNHHGRPVNAVVRAVSRNLQLARHGEAAEVPPPPPPTWPPRGMTTFRVLPNQGEPSTSPLSIAMAAADFSSSSRSTPYPSSSFFFDGGRVFNNGAGGAAGAGGAGGAGGEGAGGGAGAGAGAGGEGEGGGIIPPSSAHPIAPPAAAAAAAAPSADPIAAAEERRGGRSTRGARVRPLLPNVYRYTMRIHLS